MKKYFIFLSLFLLSIMPAYAQNPLNTGQDTIKIGILGSSHPAGKGIMQAAQLAAEEINSQGGISGRPIELIFKDSRGKADIGEYEYIRAASQEKVAAVIGSSTSEIAVQVMEQVKIYKVPFLIIGASTSKTTEMVKQDYEKYKYAFKIFHSTEEISDFTTEWMLNLVTSHKLQRAAIMMESAVWTRPLAKLWKKKLEDAGSEITIVEYIDKNTKNFKQIFSRIKDSNAQAVFVASATMDPNPYIKQWAETEGPLMAGIIGLISTLWKESGNDALSVVSIGYPGVADITPKGYLFVEKYIQKYKTNPEYTSPYTYDALYILKAALEKAESEESEKLTAALEKTDYEGIMGRWVFDPKSHEPRFGPGYRQFMMVQWQPPGKMCVIWPDAFKTCDMIEPSWYEKN